MNEVIDFDAIRISLASPEQIRSWSYGEVTKPETINYRTLKPERDGLFCERIFGPTKDFECSCGKYKRIRYKGIICDKCGVEVARAKVRRERMGHIELACAVGHIWFTRGIPSRIGLLLDLSTRSLERIVYFSHYAITSVNETARSQAIAGLEKGRNIELDDRQAEVESRIAALESSGADVQEINTLRRDFETERAESEEQTLNLVDQLTGLRRGNLLTESQYYDLKTRYPDVFEAKMGAEAILDLLKTIDLGQMRNHLIQETRSSSGQRRKKASKQLQLVEAFRRSGNKPEWMVLTVLPVLPPDLRPMVQLDGGRFATSDLNDLYRRVINRNNRLQHLLEIGAPEIIIRNEKRMLQEAVDSLIDNGRRGRSIAVSGDHKAKSISDLLRGKQGRFRQNLLGKRVDYSGRSVIVVGPTLQLHQCGLPRRMALELFKPFVMHRLVTDGLAPNIKSARRLVERARPEVYDILEDVVKDRPVMLNRAPTLHRLSIQAFEPVLIDGSAIQIHPLVCSAFNADFDGDQMAVHLPLSKAAVKEAREAMLSIHNMLLPSSGDPVVTPSLDMVFGCYYLTTIRPGLKGEGKRFGNFDEVQRYLELGLIDLRAEISVRTSEGETLKTSAGRIIFNRALPTGLSFFNKPVDKSTIRKLIGEFKKIVSDEDMALALDRIKQLGFKYATRSGITIAMSDVAVPGAKAGILSAAEQETTTIEHQYAQGLITDDERYQGVIEIWMKATEDVTSAIQKGLDTTGNVYMMATSGAKGNISQIRQMAGMRGLMTNPSGRIIDFPIKSSLREGLSAIEYFISTHGARKGLADTALRTSGSGYLTRRLIDVTQDLIIFEDDCGTMDGLWIEEPKEKGILPPLAERISGRLAAMPVAHPQTGEIIVERNGEIDDTKAKEISAAGVSSVYVRSPLSCGSRRGICQKCYWRDLGRGHAVEHYTAVGIVAAQSIGEPGTQLTLRTFHTGGVVGMDITTGLPRVEELFEARPPKAQAIISEIDGIAQVKESEEGRTVQVIARETYQDEYELPDGWNIEVAEGQPVDMGSVLATAPDAAKKSAHLTAGGSVLVARVGGRVGIEGNRLVIKYEDIDERHYQVPAASHIAIKDGDSVKAGQKLTDGSVNPQDILAVLGKEAVQRYIVEEVQKVYFSQGVHINDKHIEVIVRQMMNRVRIDSSGDTELVPGELVDRYRYEDKNANILAEGGEPATAHTVLLGITRASLSTESWLAAASFQETTRVLTDAAIHGKKDNLSGLKENVIIGKLIPAQCKSCRDATADKAAELEAAKLVQLEQPVI
ncbi:DNA-directed RNA polymerase subunit beta' [Dehalogenimonas alkenigignens]|uniref:DNA-directed RNA polymerase subunit beta' n=1 Tax=Dehalogenimonas alkenigignens TaxID=1217799 RepID=A0A0W0GJ70_9CHLR|nr:DNA-directed RNA polymerase subunit beta' [Dehalogenimonas alkenigignens]KTB48568.1 DNA-directed RNA polymerase subunit beta' [Dehalogenimonas alkenigignens]PVV84990.1 DNA-directed RNA polymerase subunit beta' [Dehalogenimonas alkenigignens]